MIRLEMRRLKVLIIKSLHTEPENFDEREEWWMQREELRSQLSIGAMFLAMVLGVVG